MPLPKNTLTAFWIYYKRAAMTEVMPVRAVFFDQDRTLVNSFGQYVYVLRKLAERLGRQDLTDNLISEILNSRNGIHHTDALPLVFNGVNHQYDREYLSQEFDQTVKTYGDDSYQMVSCYSNIVPLLEELKKRNLKTGIFTNCPADISTKILTFAKLALYFSLRASGGDQPGCFPKKPDTAGLLYLCKESNVHPHETAYVGDSIDDMKMAMAAGALPIAAGWDNGVKDGGCLEAFAAEYGIPVAYRPDQILQFISPETAAYYIRGIFPRAA